MRLVVTVLLLMVLPTALLSLLAGRSIQARELILEQQWRDDAAVRLDAVAEQVDQRIDEALASVTRMFRETVLAGSDVRRLDANAIIKSVPDRTVKNTYLFMNPVGFIYPETGGPESTGSVASVALALQPELVRVLSAGGRDQAPRVTINRYGGCCHFAPVAGYRDLYAGIQIDQAGLRAWLDERLVEHSTRVLRLVLVPDGDTDRPDSTEGAVRRGAVVIRDSLGATSAFFDGQPVAFRRHVVATRRLAVLGSVTVGAYVVSADAIRQAQALQARLVRWGIVLLGVMIVGGGLALVSSARRQVQVARRRSEFMAGMSHDLRTPVAAMRVMAESLQSGRVGDAGRRQAFLNAIVSECDRLGDLIERIMFYFRQEQGMLRYEKRVLAVEVIVAGVVERFRRQHPGRVRLVFESESSVPPVLGDANALEKVVTNLIDNAVKYGQRQALPDNVEVMEAGVDITVSVGVRGERKRIWTVLAVRDRGEGIAVGEHRRIFGRFYRANSGGHAYRGGFGLGLSLVADIVKAHRGRIRVANAPDGGAVFEVWLRAVRDDKSRTKEKERS